MRNWAWLILAALLLDGCAMTTTGLSPEETQKRKTELASVNTRLGFGYLKEGNYEVALLKLAKAVKADRNYSDAYNAYGLLYAQLGERDKARKNFERAIQLDGQNSLALNNFGQFLCREGDYERGQELFIRATNNPLYRTPEVSFSNAGTCAIKMGDRKIAEKHFRKALSIRPTVAPALIQMADITLLSERYLSARAYLQRYFEVARPTAKSLWLGIQIEEALGDRDAVSSHGLKLLKYFPDSDEQHLYKQSRVQ